MKRLVMCAAAAALFAPAAVAQIVVDADTITCAELVALDADDRVMVMEKLEAELPLTVSEGDDRPEMAVVREAVLEACGADPNASVRDTVIAERGTAIVE